MKVKETIPWFALKSRGKKDSKLDSAWKNPDLETETLHAYQLLLEQVERVMYCILY